MECICESCARKDCNERTKQDDLRMSFVYPGISDYEMELVHQIMRGW